LKVKMGLFNNKSVEMHAVYGRVGGGGEWDVVVTGMRSKKSKSYQFKTKGCVRWR